MLSVGHLLDNRYRLDERIATGGMGDVWRGTDVVLGRVIAVKVLRAAMLADPEFSARFYGEARMMAAFRHPGVVEVYDYASATDSTDDSQCAYLVMAYVEGEPLSTRLKEAGRLGVDETMSIVAQAADALHAAHENGTVHRDVKPGNLIVKPNGTVILVDFGVARSNAVTSVTGLNAIVGTALYMAPEQVAKGNVTPATDIYALGAVAYHCIAGRPPFEGDNALQVALRHLEDEPEPLPDTVPEAVRYLISRAMEKNPRDRFASAAEFADVAMAASGAVHPAITGTSVRILPANTTAITRPATGTFRAPPMPVSPPAGPMPRRRQPRSQLVVLCAVVGLTLAAIGTFITIALSSFSDDDQRTPTQVGPRPTESQQVGQANDPPVTETLPAPEKSPPRRDPATTKPAPSRTSSATPTPNTPSPPPSAPPSAPASTGASTGSSNPPENPPGASQPADGAVGDKVPGDKVPGDKVQGDKVQADNKLPPDQASG